VEWCGRPFYGTLPGSQSSQRGLRERMSLRTVREVSRGVGWRGVMGGDVTELGFKIQRFRFSEAPSLLLQYYTGEAAGFSVPNLHFNLLLSTL
jgi:hypothetical protein